MTTHEDNAIPAPSTEGAPPGLASVWRDGTLHTRLILVGILALFIPVVWEAGQLWIAYDTNAHGFIILPLSACLLWIQRDAIKRARVQPTAWGFVPLAIGLILETISYLLRIRFVAMLALVPVLAGLILILHGKNLWRVAQFPVCFLALAAPVPGILLGPIINWIQRISSTGGSVTMHGIGYAIIQRGNVIEIPGMALEVAEVCSGFHKLLALVTFALVYGYVFDISIGKRMLLVAAAVPIAVMANVVRVCALIAVSSAGGPRALHIAHDWAEVFVLIVAFFIFVTLGRYMGCKTLRFTRSSV